MKIHHILLLALLSVMLQAQSNQSVLLGTWIFESMTTITKAQREEITIVYKDEKNVETLSFYESGAIEYNVMNDGINKNGTGIWYAENAYMTIIVDSDTTYGTYEYQNNELTIITSEAESKEYYGYSTILKYFKE
tara:strand:- start:221 stop:625 length:405 start_codon:yes stop_codon:yes gene_type:complete